MNRLDRLTAILIHLQTKRVVRAQELADRFGISLRTVYRDVRSLEAAGVPIGAEAGVGYFLTDYHLPPVMFSNAEAGALLLGAKLIEKCTDQSVRTAFESALFKIKSVLKRPDQEHLDDLAPNIAVHKSPHRPPYADGLLNDIQQAIARHHVLTLRYHSTYTSSETEREVEPVGLYHYGTGWHLIAFCQTRQDYRDFRIDRIRAMTSTGRQFARRERLTLQQYLDRTGTCLPPVVDVSIVLPKDVTRFLGEQKYAYGFQSDEDLGTCVRIHFQTPYLEGFARWLLMFGSTVTIEQPAGLQTIMHRLVEELGNHYVPASVAERP